MTNVLKTVSDSVLRFYCQGCRNYHSVSHGAGTGPRWTWNGKLDLPTLQPSILVRCCRELTDVEFDEYQRSGNLPADAAEKIVCHSFVTDGQIQYLSDCSHALAGQTIPLQEDPA